MYRLKKIRMSLQITQDELAKKANIPSRSIQNYELGLRKPSVDVAIKIADALGCDVKEVFAFDDLNENYLSSDSPAK